MKLELGCCLFGSSCHIERAYKHLGTMFAEANAMGPEVAARRRAVSSAGGQLRRAVHKHGSIPSRDKVLLTGSLCTSTLLHHAAIWSELTTRQLAGLEQALTDCHRPAVGLT
eukprot:147058-Lingulodinium_polyedra.AAC.1